ncbi:MAG: competence protein CoiA family protein [Promethearchaeota archaeon]
MQIEFQNQKKKEAESIEHLKIKEYFIHNIPLVNDITTIIEEYYIGDRIADVYCELTNGKKVVIEVQHSMILAKDLIQRTKEYNENGCHVLWIFNGSSFDRLPRNEYWVRILNFEKTCQKLYHGRVYYINMKKSGIHSSVYSLYFNTFYERKALQNGFEYYRKSKIKKSVILGDIPSLNFKIFKNKKLKLAGFQDESIRERSVREILQFINENPEIAKIADKVNNTNNINKLLYSVVGKFGKIYGVNLLYDILKHRLKLKINGENLHAMNKYYSYIVKETN